jgi:hypothetical protein
VPKAVGGGQELIWARLSALADGCAVAGRRPPYAGVSLRGAPAP